MNSNSSMIQRLREIERKENIVIAYACEVGSRALGYASDCSDYDVRFLYVRPMEWYLSIMDKKDVIVYPIEGQQDMSGWDLRKALKLLQKSNPTLLEWLESPIRYMEQLSILDQIRSLSRLTFSPKACIYHYVKMARGNFQQAWEQDQARIKLLIHVLRPVLACEWIERFGSVPPMSFSTLMAMMRDGENVVRREILELLEVKRAGRETVPADVTYSIYHYVTERINYYERTASEYADASNTFEIELDTLFRRALAEAWRQEGLT